MCCQTSDYNFGNKVASICYASVDNSLQCCFNTFAVAKCYSCTSWQASIGQRYACSEYFIFIRDREITCIRDTDFDCQAHNYFDIHTALGVWNVNVSDMLPLCWARRKLRANEISYSTLVTHRMLFQPNKATQQCYWEDITHTRYSWSTYLYVPFIKLACDSCWSQFSTGCLA